ncbi:MAG: FkbM family methyltransferase, partial [Bacteroidota bacterium]
KNLPEKGFNTTRFLDHSIQFYNRNELLHSINEIFINGIYKTKFPEGSSPVIIDCGANIGLSVIYFKTKYPNCILTAYEPDQKNYELLMSNIDSMQLKDVIVKKEAVWTENKDLFFHSEGTTASRIDSSLDLNDDQTIRVKAIRFREMLQSRVHMLKMDIEGAEYEVLKDIEDKLHLVEIFFLEYHGTFQQNNRLTEMLNILTRNKFQFYIKEAHNVYDQPFHDHYSSSMYDVQLNIFCFKTPEIS